MTSSPKPEDTKAKFCRRYNIRLEIKKDEDDWREWTNAKIAARLGVSENQVSNWKGGISLPGSENLKKIATMFGVPSDYLLGGDEFPVKGKPSGVASTTSARKRRAG